MIQDKVNVYPAYITVDVEREFRYFVETPDIEGCTQGKDLAESITMARDYIGFAGVDKLEKGDPLPLPDQIEYTKSDAQIKN